MTKTKNYRIKHIFIAIAAIGLIIQGIFNQNMVVNKLGGIFVWVAPFFISGLTYEKKDELTRMNLGKANGIAFLGVLIALFITGCLSDTVDVNFLAADMYFLILLGAVAFRSIVYVILDRPVKSEEDDEEDENEL